MVSISNISLIDYSFVQFKPQYIAGIHELTPLCEFCDAHEEMKLNHEGFIRSMRIK